MLDTVINITYNYDPKTYVVKVNNQNLWQCCQKLQIKFSFELRFTNLQHVVSYIYSDSTLPEIYYLIQQKYNLIV